MIWETTQSLVLVAVVQEIGMLDFIKVSETLNSMFNTSEFYARDCEVEYNRISANRKLKITQIISVLNSERISELKKLLQDTEQDTVVKEDDIVESPRKSARRLKEDDQLKKFKQSCLLVFDKICDHKNGNVFLRRIRDKEYEKCIKVPMYLDLVKSRIKDGTISNVIEFHRDLCLICANAVMYNQEGSDVYNMALEFKEFIDSEIQLLDPK
jgi:hypothetical protein